MIFFLRRYIKAKAYTDRPLSVEQLKDAIRHKIAIIPYELICRAMEGFRERQGQCVDNSGKCLIDEIYKSK